jgi:virulence-associated protein VagC
MGCRATIQSLLHPWVYPILHTTHVYIYPKGNSLLLEPTRSQLMEVSLGNSMFCNDLTYDKRSLTIRL